LDLSHNRINEPPVVDFCTKLSELRLGWNKLRRPPVISNNTKLKILDLSYNPTLSEIPDISNCSELEHLWLSGTNIKYPPDVLEHKRLKSLALCVFNLPELHKIAIKILKRLLPNMRLTIFLRDENVWEDASITSADLAPL